MAGMGGKQPYLLGVDQLSGYHHFKESGDLGGPLATLGSEGETEDPQGKEMAGGWGAQLTHPPPCCSPSWSPDSRCPGILGTPLPTSS